MPRPVPAPQAQAPARNSAVTPALPGPGPHPLAYVLFMHQNALLALMQSRTVQEGQPGELLYSKSLAVQFVEKHGWQWPAVLDEPFPAPSPGGVKYERIFVELVIAASLSKRAILTLHLPSGDKPI